MRGFCVVVACLGCTSPADPPEDMGPSGPVTVLVTREHLPVGNATVVFHGPDGGVLAIHATDVAGTITAAIAWNGMVTVVDPTQPNALFTVTRVRPSDIPIEVALEWDYRAQPTTGTLVINAPPNAAPAQTHHLMIETACGTFEAPSLPASVPLSARCKASSDVPVIVTAWTQNFNLEDPGYPLGFFGGIASRSGNNATLIPGAWSQTCAKVDAYIIDRMQLSLLPRLGGETFRNSWPTFCDVGPPASGFTWAYPVLDFGEGVTTTSFGYVYGSLRTATLRRNFAALPASVDVGRAPDLLIGDTELVAMTGAGAEWTRDLALSDADVVIAKLTYSFPPTDTVSRYVTWRVVAPGNATEILLPSLPAAVETWPALATAYDHVLDLVFLDPSWDADVPSLAILDAFPPRQPLDTVVRGYGEQFYPDAD